MSFPERRTTFLGRHKSLNYLFCLAARQYAVDRGGKEALIMEADGAVSEGAATGVLWQEGDRLHTPLAGSALRVNVEIKSAAAGRAVLDLLAAWPAVRVLVSSFDHRLLDAASGLWLNVLHLHGSRVMFDLLAGYPVQVINWHDRETPPSLRDGKDRVQVAVLGGLRQWDTMLRGTPDEVRREAEEAIQQTGGRRFILGTGCVAPVTAPWANLRAARNVVERGEDRYA